jgi:hypothetical protein
VAALTDKTMAQVIDNNVEGQPVALIETPGNAPPIDILEIADPPKQMKAEVSFFGEGGVWILRALGNHKNNPECGG